MLGLCAMLLVLTAFISVGAYWISWEIQHKEKRPTFTAKFRNDFVALFGRPRGTIPTSGMRSAEA
jgi:hypothetical protein